MANIAIHVGNSASPTAGDIAIRDRIDVNHDFQVFDDGDPQQSGFDAVVVAESVSSTSMAGKYLTTNVPVMVMEGALWDDYGLTTAGSSTSQTTTQFTVTAGTAISGGLSSAAHTIFSTATACHNILTSSIAAGATVTATLTSDTTRAVLFYMDAGTARAGGGAALEGKRIAYGLTAAGAASAQTPAWTLFDAAIAWMVGPVGSAPTVGAGTDALIGIDQTFARTATETSDPAVTSRGWSVVSGPAHVGSLSTTTAVSFVPTVAGTYVLRYSATNSVGTSTDDLTLTVLAQPSTVTPTVKDYNYTRLYGSNVTPTPTMPTLTRRGLSTTGTTAQGILDTTIQGTAGGQGPAAFTGGEGSQHRCMRTLVSPPLTVGGVLGGFVVRNIEARENDAALNAYYEDYIYVSQGSNDAVRGVLLSTNQDTVELGTSYSRRIDKFALTPVTVQVGDRIVIETSVNLISPTHAGSANVFIYLGGTVGGDSSWYDFSHLDGLAVVPFVGWPPRVNAGVNATGQTGTAFTRTAREEAQ